MKLGLRCSKLICKILNNGTFKYTLTMSNSRYIVTRKLINDS